jgi:hypothetical protein
MRFIILFIILTTVACNSKTVPDSFIQKDWHIVQVIDGKNATGPLSMNYQYNSGDSLKPMIYFLNDTSYVLKDLFEKGSDTNYFEMHGDTLITNREPRDYLVISKGEKDSLFLINKTEQLIFTLLATR